MQPRQSGKEVRSRGDGLVLAGRKAQFFLIILVFMIIIIVGLAYYGVESRRLPAETASPAERGTNFLNQVKTEMMRALEQKPYTGANVSEYDNTFKDSANRTGFTLGVNCNETNTTVGGYPKVDLDCNLNLSWEIANLSIAFAHSYTVPFEVTTYTDADYTTESDYFYINDTVYYRITGITAHKVNMSVTHKGVQEYTQNHTLANYSATGSFVVDDGGAWQLDINDYNNSDHDSHIIHVQEMDIEIEAEGNGSEWQPQTQFLPGQWLRVQVKVNDASGRPVNLPVVISVTREYSSETMGDYNTQGTTGSGGTEGEFATYPFQLSESEPGGNLTITATELTYRSSESITITLLGEEYPHFNPLQPVYMDYNALNTVCLGQGCGYTEWFASSSQSYNNSTDAIPFYVYNATGVNNTVSVSSTAGGGSVEIPTPQVHPFRIHIIGAKRAV